MFSIFSRRFHGFVICSALLLASQQLPAEIWRSTDEFGNPVFSSEKPATSSEEVRVQEVNSFSGEEAFLLEKDNCPFKYFVFNSSREFERYGKDHGEAMMRLMYEGYKAYFGLAFAGSETLEVHVLRSQDQYFRRQRDVGDGMAQWGHYSLSRREANLYFSGSMEQTMETFFHEVSHFLNHWSMDKMPHWLNEGLATYMGNIAREGNQVVIQDNKSNNRWMVRYATTGRHIPAGQLMIIAPASWFALNANNNQGYMAAYSLVQFLLADSAARPLLLDAMKIYSQGFGDNFTLLRLVEDNYPGGAAALDIAWRQFFLRPTRPDQVFYVIPSRL